MAGIACLGAASSIGVATAAARERAHAGGCGGTPLYVGALPSWTAPAMQKGRDTSSPWVHALSRRHNVAAIVFGYPLQAGRPRANRQNKVLWIMRLARNGLSLRIEARPLHAARPIVRESYPADASPGEIYPSYVNVPTAGCWRITLRWAGHSDELALRFT